MAIEIVDIPIKNGDFPISFLYVYQSVLKGNAPGNWGDHWTGTSTLNVKKCQRPENTSRLPWNREESIISWAFLMGVTPKSSM